MRIATALLTTLVLACGSAPSAPENVSAAGRKVSVLITSDGYVPGSIKADAGEQITLSFERTDQPNCGDKVVFPSLGKTLDLKKGETKEITVTAPQSGSIAFTCGMGMYEGSVVAQGT